MAFSPQTVARRNISSSRAEGIVRRKDVAKSHSLNAQKRYRTKVKKRMVMPSGRPWQRTR